MLTRDDIVAEARTWLKTPFHHCGRVKGAGVDCVGLVVGVASNLDLNIVDMLKYPRAPMNGILMLQIEVQTDAITFEEILPADLLVFHFNGHEPQHVAIVTEVAPVRIIHAYMTAKKCIEHELDQVWIARLMYARRFKELSCQAN